MPDRHEKIKRIEGLIALGLTVSEAVQRTLGRSMTEFGRALADGTPREPPFAPAEISMCLNAYYQRTYPNIRQALADELDVPREYMDRLIDSQRENKDEEGVA